MLPGDLETIIRKGENQTVDFKQSDILSDALKLAKLIVAFANNSNVSTEYGGIILVGVKDDGSLEGMKSKQGHEEHLMNIARDKCEPSIKPHFELVDLNGNDVYVLTIPKMAKYPHAVKLQDCNAYYIRVGTTIRVATPEELQELFVATGRPTINQVIQRVQESAPSLSKAYRSMLIAPDYIIKNMIQFNSEIERWLCTIDKHRHLVIGDPYSTQDGVVFKFARQTVPEYFTKVSEEGVIYYREPIEGEDGIHIGRTIAVVGGVLEYARKVHERFKYTGSCIVKLQLGNIKDMPLVTSFPWILRGNCIFDEGETLTIERESPWTVMTQNPASIIESIITEFCRSFHFSITEETAKNYVKEFLAKG